jgi:hypothetical protein
VQWIALLLVVDSLGRICGQPFIKWIKPGVGESLNVLGYLLLAAAGLVHLPQMQAFALIYASRFFGAIASANFPSVRLITPGKGGISIAQIGFGIGCLMTATIGNYHFLPGSILLTHGLVVPGIIAAAVSAVSAVLAFTESPGDLYSVKGSSGVVESITNEQTPTSFFSVFLAACVLLACEAAFGIVFCVLPLTTREICAFSPLITAIYFAVFALLSVGVMQLTRSLPRSTITLIAGIIFSSVGFLGISVALKLSWSETDTRAQLHGIIGAWISGAIGAVGHGLLRASLPSVRRQVRFNTDWVAPIIAAVGAVFISRLWVAHERSTFAIPAAILLTALPTAFLLMLIPSRKPRGFAVLTDTPSRI